MKKKLLSLLLTAVAATTAVCLTACGGDEKGNEKDDGFKGLKSEKINSAEAWAAAFDFSEIHNVTFNRTCVYENVAENAVDAFDVNLYYSYSLSGDRWSEQYFEYKDDEVFSEKNPDSGTVYSYSRSSENEEFEVERNQLYIKRTADFYMSNNVDAFTVEYDEQTDEVSGYMHERYAEFKYDDSKYAYTIHVENYNDEEATVDIAVKFKNGKFAEVYAVAEMNEQGSQFKQEITIEVSKIGTTVINIPEISDESDSISDLYGVYTMYQCDYDDDGNLVGLLTYAPDRNVPTEIELIDGMPLDLVPDGFKVNGMHFVKIADGEYFCAQISNYWCKKGKTPSYPIVGEF